MWVGKEEKGVCIKHAPWKCSQARLAWQFGQAVAPAGGTKPQCGQALG
jgi:hypothetical protein